MIESCSHRTIGHAYGADFPEFHILTFSSNLMDYSETLKPLVY